MSPYANGICFPHCDTAAFRVNFLFLAVLFTKLAKFTFKTLAVVCAVVMVENWC